MPWESSFVMQLFRKKLLNGLETVVKAFKKASPASDCVPVIVIDKDFTEHNVLITGFPQAKILFCQFHVIKYLYKKVYPRMIEKTFEVN